MDMMRKSDADCVKKCMEFIKLKAENRLEDHTTKNARFY